MLDLIKKAILGVETREAKIHIAREFLQLLTLKILYDRGYFKNLAFVGGTALRVLYDLRRFSEDLDFSLINREGYNSDAFLRSVVYELKKNGFSLDVKEAKEKTVQSAILKFKDILFTLGLSNLKAEKLSIRVEIDANPPTGWDTNISLVNKYFVFTVTHFDIPSLYATKLHACFFRKYTKGRDFYDLLWYLGKKTLPNFKFLNNAIEQTEGKKGNVDERNFRDFLQEKLASIDFGKVRKDVERFIVDKNELKLLDAHLILNLLDSVELKSM
ncbi:MAG: nucleotidyl transferase AbiEii/AbiGii toxin family protein [bacterium]